MEPITEDGSNPFTNVELDTYASILERDVDLVLVAALRTSAKARRLFSTAVGLYSSDLVFVRHSLTTSDRREADIELRLGTLDRPDVIQIENKLDSPFQQDQPEDYAIRAKALSDRDDVAEARSALFCPSAYAGTAHASLFDGVVHYESLRDLLLDHGELGREAALVVEHAIRKHRRGGANTPDDMQRTSFFTEFADLARDQGLPAVPRRARKAGAGTLWWPRDVTLRQPRGWNPRGSEGAWLAAKFEQGAVDVELTSLIQRVDLGRLSDALEAAPVTILTSRKSIFLRVPAPPMSPDQPLTDQSDLAAAFVDVLLTQRNWWEGVGCTIVEQAIAEGTTR